jgi:2,4-dienoyl-CoA reductase-like NADH-dependent reductase (Old Yellow Enzyme family)
MDGVKFKKLFEPIVIKGMVLKNRIVMGPMCTCFADDYVSQKTIDYFVERAKGGAGLVQLEAFPVASPQGKNLAHMLLIDDDKYIPGLRKLVEAMKDVAPDVKVTLQLYHGGGQTDPKLTGVEPVAASAICTGYLGSITPPRALTKEEIQGLVEAFGEGARRTREAGIDAVNVHFAHGYLLGNFIAPRTNRRTDEYGGSLENRLKFPMEVLRMVRAKVGKDYPVIVRMNASDFVPGGQTFAEAKAIAGMCVNNGADVIDVSGIVRGATEFEADSTMASPRGCWVKYAQEIKEVVGDTPVIGVRRIMTPMLAEKILRETDIDLICLARPFLADPYLPTKAKEGRIEDIVPCIACNQGCYDHLPQQKPITCMMNPAVGREREYEIKPAVRAKKVFIIGGGPAGLEAAKISKMRGHDVTLFEKSDRLGGQINLALIPPFREEFGTMLDYYQIQMNRLGVRVRLETEATPELIQNEKPDVVIVANGPAHQMQKIEGVDPSQSISMLDVLKRRKEIGKNVIISCAGFCCANKTYFGCEIAELLAKEGKHVRMVTFKEDIIDKMTDYRRSFEKKRIVDLGIRIEPKTKIKKAENGSLYVEQDGQERILEYDTLVNASIFKKDDRLFKALQSKVPEVYHIGDGAEIGNALDAIHAAAGVARKI